MAGTTSSPFDSHGWFAPAWLPLGGHGNGLPAATWAPLADVDARIVDTLLDLMAAAHVPAHAAPAPAPVRPLLPTTSATPRTWHLWVGSTFHAKGEDVLLHDLGPLLRTLDVPTEAPVAARPRRIRKRRP